MLSDSSRGEFAILQRSSNTCPDLSSRYCTSASIGNFINLRAVHKPPIHLLLRTLLDRPELGQHVKEIIIQEQKSIQSIWQDQDRPELEFGDL
jgi:hypothetical protein